MRVMVALFVSLAMLGAAGCGDSPTAPSKPSQSTVIFRLDANSCGQIFGTQTLNFAFFIDGIQVGSANLGIGIPSPGYRVTPGSHVGSASVTNSTIRWENINFSVLAGNTFTYILTC